MTHLAKIDKPIVKKDSPLDILLSQFSFDLGSPRYLQLAHFLEQAIKQNLFPSGFLPPERDLAKLLNVSRVTISHSLDILASKNLVIRQQGLGTQINRQFDYSLNQLGGFTQRMTNAGYTVSDQWITKQKIVANQKIAEQLSIDDGCEIAYLHRVRLIDNIPISIESTYVPIRYLPEPEAFSGSLYQYWDKKGIYPTKKTIHLNAISCDKLSAKLLKQPEKTPLLQIHEINRNQHDDIIELSIIQCLSDYYALKIQL